jgi:Arc/MetJ family transcription regulator
MVATMASMGRTNIEIEDALLQRVMNRYHLKTKREAVEYALRKVAGLWTPEQMLKMEGRGWDGDLDELRGRRRGLE